MSRWTDKKGNQQGWVKKGFAIGLVLIFLCGMLPDPVLADKAETKVVKLEVFPGFDGSYRGPWVPVRVKITNLDRVDLEGEVLARPHHEYQSVVPFQKVQVAAGTSKEVSLVVPGEMAYGDTRIRFVTAGHKPVEVKMGGKTIGDEAVSVGILSDTSSTSRFLEEIARSDTDRPLEIHTLKGEEIPTIAEGLSGLNVLVINNFSTETLRPAQQQAIHQWVKQGGTLLVAGGSGITQSIRGLEALLPIEIEGTGTVEDLKGLSSYGKVPAVDKVTVSKGKLLEEGRSLVIQDGMPLVASRSLGQGQVLYAAYDLSAAPLAEWPGNKNLWGELFMQQPIHSGESEYEQYWSLQDGVQYIPDLKLPSLWIMALLFVVYVLVIGPLLFLLLARFRRKEWGWWIIPLCSIAVCFLVYVYGSFLRGSEAYLHNLALVQLSESGEARAKGVSGLVVPEAGTFHVTTETGTFAWPTSNMMSFTSARNEKVMTHANKSDVFFVDSPHWSMRSLFFDATVQTGNIETNFVYQKDKLVGEVTNDTKYPLRDVGILLGNNYHKIGSMAPGASSKLEIPHSKKSMMHFSDMVGAIGREKPLDQREESLVYQLEGVDISSSILLIGWLDQPLVKHEVVGYSQKEEHLSLFYTPVKIAPSKDGKVVWAPGLQWPSVVDSTEPFDEHDKEFYLDRGGKLTLEYRFDSGQPIEASKLEIFSEYKGITEVYNWSRNKWEEIALDQPITGKDATKYLSADNRLQMRFTGNGDLINAPRVGLEGRVNP